MVACIFVVKRPTGRVVLGLIGLPLGFLQRMEKLYIMNCSFFLNSLIPYLWISGGPIMVMYMAELHDVIYIYIFYYFVVNNSSIYYYTPLRYNFEIILFFKIIWSYNTEYSLLVYGPLSAWVMSMTAATMLFNWYMYLVYTGQCPQLVYMHVCICIDGNPV